MFMKIAAWVPLLWFSFNLISTPVQAEIKSVYEDLQTTGVEVGTPVFSASALSTNSLHINSSEDAIQVAPSPATAVGSGDFAVSFWLLLSPSQSGSDWLNLLHKGNSAEDRTFSLWLRPSDQRISYNLSTNSNAALGGLSVNAISTDTWTHIAYVKEANQLKLFLNGRLDSTTALSGDILTNTGNLYIGASPWRNAALGFYDHVSIYHRQLTALEVASLYQAEFPNYELEDRSRLLGTPAWLTGIVAGQSISGKALQINSNDDTGMLANSINFAGYGGDFSLSFWMRLEAGPRAGKWRNLMHKSNSRTRLTFLLMLRPDNNRLYFRLSTTSNWNEGGESTNPIPVNQWTHVSYVKAGNTLNLYFNGQLDKSVTLTGDVVANTGPLYIGASPWTLPAFASYDQINLVKRALNATDVSRLFASQVQPAHVGGQWGKIIPWPHIAVSAAHLPDGRILTWSGSERTTWPSTEKTYSATWNPQTGSFLELLHQGHNMFCAHLAMTEEGKVFVNGGRNGGNSPWTSLFDYRDNRWVQAQNMITGGRWYPTTVALPSGEMMTAMGSASNVANPEKWSPDIGWQVLNTINFMQMRTTHQGTTGDNRSWPILSVTPRGEVFHFWSNEESFLINTQNTGEFRNAQTVGGNANLTPGTAIQYDVGQLLITGSGQGSWGAGGSSQAFTVDLNGPTPEINIAPPMLSPRMFHNLVTLPTGEVLVIGGAEAGLLFSDQGTIEDTEIWNPTTRQWRRAAPTRVPRNYHSIALLLDDGRVLSAGGGYCGGYELCGGASYQNAQIYSPPYLFNTDGSPATRPEITSSPGIIQAGQTVAVSANGDIRGFTLLKMSATTHAVNTDARFTKVEFVPQGSGQYQLTFNSNPNVLTPGYWMLFALNQNNVPSVAKIIRIERPPSASTTGPNRYVKLVAKTEVSGNPWTSVAELNVLDGNGQPIDRSNWAIAADSQNSNHPPQLVLDNKANTVWHTEWKVPPDQVPATPHQLIINLRDNYSLSGLTYLPRQDRSFGRIGNYDVFLSANGTDWRLAASGQFANSPALQTVNFGAVLNELNLTPPLPSAATQMASFAFNFASTLLPTQLAALQFQWSFGDGTPATAFSTDASTVTHQYSQPGVYVVVVTVRDSVSGIERIFTTQKIIYDASVNIAQPQRWQSSSPISFHPSRPQVWNVNPDNNSVSVVDTNSLTKVAEIAVGQQPSSLAFTDTGDVWVTNKSTGTISVLDAALLTLKNTINLPNFASRPHGIVIDNGFAYVVLQSAQRLLKLNTVTQQIVQQVPVMSNPRHLALSRDGSQVYVSNFITPPVTNESTAIPDVSQGTLGVLALQSADLSTVNAIAVQHSTDLVTENTGPGLPNYLGALAINPAEGPAYLPAKQDNILGGSLRSGSPLTFDQAVRAVDLQIDLSSFTESVEARIDHDNASVASASLFGPYGIHLLTALEGNRQVAISNTLTGSELTRFDVGRAPQGLALSPNGLLLAVHNFMDRSISLVDISNIVQAGGTQATVVATVSTVTSERLSPQVLLGKKLFYDAADDRLASLDYMSCASCHHDGGHDGRVWDFTQFGEGLRNTIGLRGHGGMAQGLLHWTGNFDELQDFESQIRFFAGGTGLMNDIDFFFGTRNLPLGLPKVGLSTDLDALAAFLSSLSTTENSPLKNPSGLSTLALQGQSLFNSYQCAGCHSGTMFTDSILQIRHNVGTLNAASGSRSSQNLDGLDTPSLLGLWSTAPYLHNGSAASVSAAIAAHRTPAVNNGVPISTAHADAIAAYLLELPL